MKKIVLMTLIVTFVFSASAYAQNVQNHFYWIYTWGYSDIMISMLNAVKQFMGTENYSLLLKVSVLLSLFTIFLSLLSDRGFSPVLIFQKVLLVIAIQILVLSSPVTVVVEEVQNGVIGATQKEQVTDVPAVIAFPLATLSQMEKAVRDTLRNSLNYGGLTQGALYLDGFSAVTALNMLQSSMDIRPNNPNFTKTFNSYMENCILPDMISGYQDITKIAVSKNLWQQFGLNVHAARIGSSYLDPAATGPDGVIKTCRDLYTDLNNAINTVSTDAQARLKAGLGLSAAIQLDQSLGAISSAIMNYQTTGADMIKNSLAINSFNDSYQQIAAGMGVDSTGIAYSMAKAQETAKLNSSMQGIMAKKYMPMAKGYLTVIFVAVMPLVLLIAMVTGTFRKPFGMIFGLLTALALWNVGDQILDFIIIVRTHALFEASNIAGIGYTLESQPFINGAIMDTLTLSLGMYWIIPTLAFSIATMSGYGAASMMGGISGIATAGASSAAAEAAGGNMNFGNVRANAINMNKYDAASMMSVGSVSKMSMDHQQTASIQSNVSTGTRNIHDDTDSIKETGTTHIYGPNGKHYQVNGTTEMTAAGLVGKGMIQEMDSKGNVIKEWKGEITASGDMSNYRNNFHTNKNGAKEDAFFANNIVSTNLDASNVKTANDIKEAKTVEDYSKLKDTSDTEKNNYTRENKHTEDDSTSIIGGRKVDIGNNVNGDTTALAMVEKGLSKYTNDDLMKESFINNMTSYQNKVFSRTGSDTLSEQQVLAAIGGFHAQAGLGGFGSEVSASIDAKLQAQLSHNSGQMDSADLNRIMNSAIVEQLEIDAKNNNWTAEQYDAAARERFGAYNDYLHAQAGGQAYGPGNMNSEILAAGKELVNQTGELVVDATNTAKSGIDTVKKVF